MTPELRIRPMIPVPRKTLELLLIPVLRQTLAPRIPHRYLVQDAAEW